MNATMRHPRHPLARAMLAGTFGLALLASACSPIRATHGFMPDKELVEQIRPGVHDEDSVASLLGHPTSKAGFRQDTWLYIERKSQQLAFFAPEVTEQKVLAIDFDKDGIVRDVRHLSLKDANQIQLVQRETPTRGKELTMMEQFFGNLGRFNNSADNGVGRPGGPGPSPY